MAGRLGFRSIPERLNVGDCPRTQAAQAWFDLSQ
jgi:hypothetical protein